MKLRATLLIELLMAIAVGTVGCGGGGSGGSDGEQGNQSSARRGVRVLHGAIEAAPIRVVSTPLSDRSQGKLLGETFFGQVKGYAEITEEPLAISAALRSGSEPTIGQFEVNPGNSSRYSVIVSNLPGEEAIRATLVEDVAPALESGQGAVRLVHTVARAETVTVTLSGAGGEFKTRAGFGQAGSYEVIPQGSYQAVVRRSVDGLIIANSTVEISSQKAITILVGGEIGVLVFAKVLDD